MNNKTILVIEDNSLNMKLINAILSTQKFQILTAGDAETGLKLAHDHHPDLILMDIQLPGIDGLSATKILKDDDNLKEIPVVALTSYAMQGDEEKAKNAGCDGYIPKPINTRKFLKHLSPLLENEKTNKNNI